MTEGVDRDELKLRDEWFAESKTIRDSAGLKVFVDKLIAFSYGYGTIVRAMAAAMNAAFYALENSPQGGITGFQASCLFWDVEHLLGIFGDGPKKMVKYSDLLYPQNQRVFNTISSETWAWLQREAEKNLHEAGHAHPDVKAHWQKIVNGVVPFGFTVEK